MALAFDASSTLTPFTTSNSWTHTPVGTPRAVVVYIAVDLATGDVISAVTYGGVSMTEAAVMNRTAGAEDGGVYIYFLGASIPTGAQTVSVTVSSGTTSKTGWAVSLTGAADTQQACAAQTSEGNTSAAMTDTLPTTSGFTGTLHSVCFSGVANTATLVVPSSHTTVTAARDFGTTVAKATYLTGASGADKVVTWSSSDQDFAMASIAVEEISTADPRPIIVAARR